MSGEAESAGHNCFMHKLSNEAWRNFDRKECLISISVQYQYQSGGIYGQELGSK